MNDMGFVRKVVRGSKKKFDYSLNYPRKVVEILDLIDATVELVIKDDKLIITKIADGSDDTPKKVKTSKPEDRKQHGSSDGLII